MKFQLLFFIMLVSKLYYFGQNNNCQCKEVDEAIFNKFLVESQNQKAYDYLNNLKFNSKLNCQAFKFQLLSEYFTIGNQYNLDSVKFYLDKEKPLLPKLKCDLKLEMEYYSNLSTYYLINNDLNRGNEFLLKSLNIAEKLKDYNQLYLLYSNLSILFSHLNQSDKMIFYTQKVRNIAYKNNDKTEIVKRLSFVADSYNNYFNQSKKNEFKDSVFVISKEILKIAKKIKYDFGLFRSYELMHNKPFYEGNFKESLRYLDSAMMYIHNSKSFNSIQSKATIYRKKHEIYLKQNDFKKALMATDSLYKFAMLSKQDYTLLGVFKRKYETHKAMNDSKNALLYFEKFSYLQDSVYGKEKLEIVNELETKYNKVKNEKQILKLQQEKRNLDQNKTIDSLKINLLVVGIVLLFLGTFFVIILFRQRNLRQIQTKNNLELKLNRSRINPHFFFNSLTAFQSILIKEDNKKRLLLNFGIFSKFMRQILEGSYDDFITIENEIQMIENYVKLQLLRDENKFVYDIKIADDLQIDEILIPAMVLQPIIENAIEHGFKTFQNGGNLEIVFSGSESKIKIQIIDNGIFLINESNKLEHKSRANQITSDRFELLTKLYKKPFEINTEISENGTIVTLLIPLLFEIAMSENQ